MFVEVVIEDEEIKKLLREFDEARKKMETTMAKLNDIGIIKMNCPAKDDEVALEKRVAELEEDLKAQPEKMCEYVSGRICESLAGEGGMGNGRLG